MARLEDVSDDESGAAASSTRARGRRADLRSRIPLTHPSALPKPTKAPLLSDIPIPDNLTRTRMVYQHGNELSPEDLAELEDDEDDEGGAGAVEEVEVVEEEEEDEFFTTLLMAVPFSFLYLLMDILVYFQYNHRPKPAELVDHMLKAVPTLGFIIFYTNRHIKSSVTIAFLLSASILSGTRLIWLVNKASWSVTTAQAPAVGTLWILTIVQLPLSRAVIALAAVAAWTYYTGMKLMP